MIPRLCAINSNHRLCQMNLLMDALDSFCVDGSPRGLPELKDGEIKEFEMEEGYIDFEKVGSLVNVSLTLFTFYASRIGVPMEM